ncbi:DsbA family protein [Kangiella sp. HZ709]|uniref:DsbA family protein n=1 Tax=Kangiella sp. HZ709 TaxID=2666328 RepID=UPI0012B108DF|nr:DsbA family protein [Kangiella sp. HZ709]MRX28056.1 thioredoxin domain-containing protein [Kangiella sp. HZ709]
MELNKAIVGLIVFASTLFSGVIIGATYWELTPENEVKESDNLYFTWLGCDSCLMIEQEIDDSDYKTLPLIARSDWRPAAKILLALQLLAVELELQQKFRQLLLDKKLDPTDLSAMTAALVELGVNKEDLDSTLKSKELFTAVQRSQELARYYQVKYVPTFIVNGKFATDAKSNKSIKKLKATLATLQTKQIK